MKSAGLLSRLTRDRRGISAIEFAFIAPVMALVYFGCIELSTMMSVDRKVTSAASALGDLVARDDEITNDEMADVFDAVEMILQPYSTNADTLRLRVSSLYDDSGTIKVRWSDAQGTGMSAYAEDTVVSIPNNLMPSSGTLILAEIEYDFESNIGYVIKTDKKLTDTFYLRPRRVDEVARNRS